MITLTRRYHFSASHRLHSPHLSPAENDRLYGKCNHQFGHGHNYVLAVTIAGEPDPTTGLIAPVSELDRLVTDRVLQLFAHRYINKDVAQFESLVPTTENIVLVIGNLLEQSWPLYFAASPARLHRVHIEETGRNGFELLLAAPQTAPAPPSRVDSLLVAQ